MRDGDDIDGQMGMVLERWDALVDAVHQLILDSLYRYLLHCLDLETLQWMEGFVHNIEDNMETRLGAGVDADDEGMHALNLNLLPNCTDPSLVHYLLLVAHTCG